MRESNSFHNEGQVLDKAFLPLLHPGKVKGLIEFIEVLILITRKTFFYSVFTLDLTLIWIIRHHYVMWIVFSGNSSCEYNACCITTIWEVKE